jgi:protein-S-isoprenylcysteine O-methyltransferase Ste14
MKSIRLRSQGVSNLHRKLIFRLLAIGLVAYLFYAPDPWTVHGPLVACMQIAGILLMFSGIIGRILSTLSIGGRKDRVVVQTELYSICRNPLYFASFLMAIGLGLLSTRVDFTAMVIVAYLAIFYPMMLNEAKVLRVKFPEFGEYETRVPLFFPNFRLWQQRNEFQINHNRVMRTLFDASLILLAIPVMVVLQMIS